MHGLGKDRYIEARNNGLLEFLEEIRRGDKVRHVGFSFHDNLEAFKYILDDYDW